MRYYAWYSPEIDVIIFQIIMEGCCIAFEWRHSDINDWLYEHEEELDKYLWMPLGEL